MKYLLDVNVLVAWGWLDHLDHDRTVKWIAASKHQEGTLLMTSVIPQLGFVRVSVQRTGGRVSVKEASETLAGMLQSLGARHQFLADDRPIGDFPAWCQSAARTTDAHLLKLAAANGARLATLDASIPGAVLIPNSAESA